VSPELTTIADILVKHRGSLDTSELARLEAAREIVNSLQAKVEELEAALWKCLAQSDELTDKQFRDKFKRLCGDLFRVGAK